MVSGCIRVKLRADILPAGGHEDFAFRVEQGKDHTGQLMERVAQGLEHFDVDDIVQFQSAEVVWRGRRSQEFFLDARFVCLQFLFGQFFGGEITDKNHKASVSILEI